MSESRYVFRRTTEISLYGKSVGRIFVKKVAAES